MPKICSFPVIPGFQDRCFFRTPTAPPIQLVTFGSFGLDSPISPPKKHWNTKTRWRFQIFFIFTPICGRFPFWLIFFNWAETTNCISWRFRFFLGVPNIDLLDLLTFGKWLEDGVPSMSRVMSLRRHFDSNKSQKISSKNPSRNNQVMARTAAWFNGKSPDVQHRILFKVKLING